MQYGLSISTGAQRAAAKAPKLGVETRLKYSLVPIERVGEVEFSAEDTAVYDADETFVPPVAGGQHYQAVLLSANPGSAITLTFAVVLSDASVGTATATFDAPSWAPDQGEHMPQGVAVDLVPSSLSIRSITSLTTATGGASGVKVGFLSLPDTADWKEINCPVQKNVTLGAPASVAVPCRYNPIEHLKKGRGDVPTVMLSAKYSSLAMGLGRLNGHKATIMFETWNDDTVLVERLVGQSILKMNIPRGEVNEEVVISGEGFLEQLAVFV